jgi:hypothetical protein
MGVEADRVSSRNSQGELASHRTSAPAVQVLIKLIRQELEAGRHEADGSVRMAARAASVDRSGMP